MLVSLTIQSWMRALCIATVICQQAERVAGDIAGTYRDEDDDGVDGAYLGSYLHDIEG